jgi:hypothetical protein
LTEKGVTVPKLTAFKLALFSALLGVWFGYERAYVCLGAAFLLMLVFDWLWAAKAWRDKRQAARPGYQPPAPVIPKTSAGSIRLSVPRPSDAS